MCLGTRPRCQAALDGMQLLVMQASPTINPMPLAATALFSLHIRQWKQRSLKNEPGLTKRLPDLQAGEGMHALQRAGRQVQQAGGPGCRCSCSRQVVWLSEIML